MEDRHVSMGPTSAHSTPNHHPYSPRHSHLNLIRSVTTILEIMNRAMKEQNDRMQLHQRSLSPSRSPRSGPTLVSSGDRDLSDDDADGRDPVFNFSGKHKLLQLQLQPLTRVQKDLEKYIGSAALGPDQVGTAPHAVFPDPESSGSPRRHTEFSVSVHNHWKARLSGKEDFKKGEFRRVVERKSIQDLHGATEILYRCGSDIKQLWADDVVQQVLKGSKAQLQHSSGLYVNDALCHPGYRLTRISSFMDDIDRVVARDYEPSDQDVVKARLRTVGVQEYHFSIPGGEYSTFDANVVP